MLNLKNIVIFLAVTCLILAAVLIHVVRWRGYPADITRDFWTALATGDVEYVRELVREEDRDEPELIESLLPVGRVTLGRTVIEGKRAWVDTDVEIRIEELPSVALRTVLVYEEGFWTNRWRVDYGASTALVEKGANVAKFMDGMRELGKQITDQVEGVMEGLQKAIPEAREGLSDLEKDLRAQIPEWKKKLDEFARELEEAIESGPPQESGEGDDAGI